MIEVQVALGEMSEGNQPATVSVSSILGNLDQLSQGVEGHGDVKLECGHARLGGGRCDCLGDAIAKSDEPLALHRIGRHCRVNDPIGLGKHIKELFGRVAMVSTVDHHVQDRLGR